MLTNDYAEAIASWTQYYEANPQPHATASRTWQSTAHPKATPQRGSARPSPSHDTSTDAHTGATSATAPNAPHRNGSHHDHTGRVGQPTTAHGYRRVVQCVGIWKRNLGDGRTTEGQRDGAAERQTDRPDVREARRAR
jgi:hypothetical protein